MGLKKKRFQKRQLLCAFVDFHIDIFPMDYLANQLELNSSRNTLLCLSQYSVCLTAGCLSERNKWRENLLNLYARISLCRTINRSLDYFGCLSRIRKYSLGQNVIFV